MRLIEFWLHRLSSGIDLICEITGRAVAWLTLGMVLTTFTVVVLRYGFNTGWIAMQEAVLWMHASVFLVAAAYTLKHDAHVRVDIFYSNFTPGKRALVDLLGGLLLLLPSYVFIFYISWDYVRVSWEIAEGSRETGGIPAIYLLKSSILLMAGLMILQGISRIIHSLMVLMGIEQAEAPEPPRPGTPGAEL